MSHHFDTKTATDDPRLNLCDFYLFRPSPGRVAMALTVNPNAGDGGSDTFHDEAVYAFRFDLDADAGADVAFMVRFSEVQHTGGSGRHDQTFEVVRGNGSAATEGFAGDLIAQGHTGGPVEAEGGIQVFAGLVDDAFAGDSHALHAFKEALTEGRFTPENYQNRQNFFAGRQVSALVLEVPVEMIGVGLVGAWSTVSLFGHAPEEQVARWGLPLITHFFVTDPQMQERYNRSGPEMDHEVTAPVIATAVERTVTLAQSADDPAAYAARLVERICPTVLPYQLDSVASFDHAGFNGRSLSDDVMDVMLTLWTNTALGDGVRPERTRYRDTFPYFVPVDTDS
jgi:hypothetical protein